MKRLFRLITTTLGLGLGFCLSLTINSRPAGAAESVVLKYRFFERSIPVEDLSNLAETGEISRPLRAYLRLAGRDPEELRSVLNRDVPVDVVVLDRVLNSPVGNVMLDKVSESIHTASGEGDRQAMRSALVLSASDDDRIQLIELIEKYPTQEIHVNGDRLIVAYEDIVSIQRRLDRILEGIGLF